MKYLRNRFVQSFIAIFVFYIAIIVLISQNPSGDAYAIDDALIEKSSEDRLEVLMQITGVDPLKGTAEARVLPWPNSEAVGYRFKSGWLPKKDVLLHVDSVIGASNGGSNLYEFKRDVPVGGFDLQIDQQPGESNRSQVAWYPLDLYAFEIPVSASYTDDNGDIQDLAILPLDYTKNIDTFDVRMAHGYWSDPDKLVILGDIDSIENAIDEFNQGLSSSVFTADRSNSTKLLVVIILLLMITALVSVTIMAYMVANGRRPPTLSSLIWSAALTYSLISLRGLMPGAPPIGIFIDKVVYFPSLVVTLTCSLWILVIWTKRDDFES
jgi:hypothetical protein